MTTRMYACVDVATLLRPAALQILQAYFFCWLNTVAENRKISAALGLTGGKLHYHTCSSWHNGPTTARVQPRPL